MFVETFNKMFCDEFELKDLESAASIIDKPDKATIEMFSDMFDNMFDEKYSKMFNKVINAPAALSK